MNRRGFLIRSGVASAGLVTWVPLASAAQASKVDAAPSQNPAVTAVEVLEKLWAAIRDHYPMLEFVGVHDDAWLDEFRPRVAAAKDLAAAFPIMEELVCRLRDYHTRLWWPGKPDRASLPVLGHLLPGREPSLVVVRRSAVEGVGPGDEIVRVGGLPVQEALAAAWRYAVGSTPEAQSRSAVDRMLSAAPGAEVALELRERAGAALREVRLHASGYPDDEPTVSDRALDKDTGYIRIPRWYGKEGEDLPALFDTALERYRLHSHLVIDVRGNGGGSDALADAVTGRFIRNKIISSISFHREAPSLQFRRTVEWCEPRGPWTYEGRVAVLIDEGCASACEHFVSGMIGAGACLAGMPTNGACGWIGRIGLPGGAVLFCSRTFPLHGGTPSPLHGLEPHFREPLTQAALRARKDVVLERAQKWLGSGEPLPVRHQPVL
ncbi:MAG TPA: S41 family peptidase [Armatimonadota bacterium]|nr:S41 family peptidase [Armatimonadota bacterium]